LRALLISISPGSFLPYQSCHSHKQAITRPCMADSGHLQ
jgi:hypothetical protein